MSEARDKIRQAQQILRECNCNLTFTVNNVPYSIQQTVSFVTGAMADVAAQRGGTAEVTIQRSTVSVRYTPLSRQLP